MSGICSNKDQNMNKTPNEDLYKLRLLPVLRQIQDNLDAELELASMAKVACMSQYHFHRVFKAVVGENLKEHLRRLKLERAASKLREKNARIIELAFEAGFSSHEAFTRAFNKAFGVSPSAFRSQQNRLLPSKSGIHFGQSLNDFSPCKYGETNMQVTETFFPEVSVVYRHHIGVDSGIPEAWGEMIRWGHQAGLINESTRFITIGYDDPSITAADKQRFDLCFTSEQTPHGTLPLKSRTIGNFKVAKVIHKGDLNGIESTFMAFYGSWLPASGLEPLDHPPLVEYLNSPYNTPTEDLRTALYIPVQ